VSIKKKINIYGSRKEGINISRQVINDF